MNRKKKKNPHKSLFHRSDTLLISDIQEKIILFIQAAWSFFFILCLLPSPGISWANTYLKHQNTKDAQTQDCK